MKLLLIQKEVKVDLVQHEISFLFLFIINMKYKIEWTFKCGDTSSIQGNTTLEDTTPSEVQSFIMEWFPSLVVDLMESFAKKLKEKGIEEDTRLLLLNSALNMCCMRILRWWLWLISDLIEPEEDQDEKWEDLDDFNLFDRIGWAQQEK